MGSTCPECVVQFDHYDFLLVEFLSPVSSIMTFGTHADLAPCSVRTQCRLVFRPFLMSRFVGIAECFAAFLSGCSMSSFSCSSVSSERFVSCSFAAWLKARSSLLLLITGCTYCSLELGLVFSFVSHFPNFLDCCSVSDDLYLVARHEIVIAPVSEPFFTDTIGLVARVSRPSQAVNCTFLRVP